MRAPYKPRVARKFIGAYRPRIDARDKASGKTLYADDITLGSRFPGLLYAKVLRSPHAHAQVKSLDTTDAARMPGVKAILTCQDPEVAALPVTSAGWTDGVDTVSYERMMWHRFRDRRVLPDTACWAGDEVGAVLAAETEREAEEALRAIKVEGRSALRPRPVRR
jgi:xanthine dehydrogenase molybdenum-binding subunit